MIIGGHITLYMYLSLYLSIYISVSISLYLSYLVGAPVPENEPWPVTEMIRGDVTGDDSLLTLDRQDLMTGG